MAEQSWEEKFLRYLIVERGYSDKTRQAYKEDIDDFKDFLKESGEENLLSIDHLDVRVYLGFLSDKEYSRNTISRKIASLRSFYQYLLKEELIEENPFSYVHLKKKIFGYRAFFMKMKCRLCLKALLGINRWTSEIEQY